MKFKIDPSRMGVCFYAIEKDVRDTIAEWMEDYPYPKLESIRDKLKLKVGKSKNNKVDNDNNTTISWGL